MNYSAVLQLIALVEAGLDLWQLIQDVRAKEAAGATPEEISKYIDDLYEQSYKELNETP